MNQLGDIVRQTSYDIHVYHGHGYHGHGYHGHGMFEKIYERALAHRLRKLGIDVKQQHSPTVYDEDGTSLGDYIVGI